VSDLDALLARSQKPGAFANRKRFTLSRDKAVEKMRQFTLRHPEQYLLELIQGAVFAGARWIFVDIDSSSVTVGWIGGTPLRHSDVDGIFDNLFSDQLDPRRRHLHQIAVALNAMLQREPHLIRMESGDGAKSVRLDLNRHGSGEVGTPEDSVEGTYIHATFSRGGWLQRFAGASSTQAGELVEIGCMFCPVPIFLNGDGPLGWDRHTALSSYSAHDQELFDADGREGWVAESGPDAGAFEIVIGGVRVTTRKLPQLGSRFRGVIRDDRLRKTADMSDVVEDENFRAMLAAVQPHATAVRRRRKPKYNPPKLPPVKLAPQQKSGERGEKNRPGGKRTVPIRKGVRLLGLSRKWTLDAFRELAADEPLFWIPPGEVVDGEIDPLEFPYRIALLGPRQIKQFAEQVPHLKPHRVKLEDLDFVRDQFAKSIETTVARIATDYGDVELRLHRAGPMPGWGLSTGVEVLVVHEDKTWFRLDVPVNAPRVSAICRSDDGPLGTAKDVLAARVATTVARNLWRLLPVEGGGDRVSRQLAAAILAVNLKPFFVATEDGVALQSLLAPGTPAEHERLLDAPLTASGVTARSLMAAAGTDTVFSCDAGDLTAIAPLEEWLGAGHLAGEAEAAPICEIVYDGRVWTDARPSDAEGAIAFLRVERTFRWTTPDGFEPLTGPVGVVHGGRRPGVEIDYAHAWKNLERVLTNLTHRDGASDHYASHDDRCRADVRRLALLALRVADPQGHPALQSTAGSFRSGMDVAATLLCSRGGPELDERQTAAITMDELRVLEQLGEVRLRFDDPPEVWSRRPVPSDPAWLVTVDVDTRHALGWIGFRYPYDPTGSVLVRRGGAIWAGSGLDAQIKCHGMVRARGDGVERTLTSVTKAGDALLRELRGTLHDADRERRQAARSYARNIAWFAQHGRGSLIPRNLAAELADRVPVVGDDGKKWGSFRLWLQTDPALRPVVSGLPEVPQRENVPAKLTAGGELEARISLAISRIDSDLEVQVLRTHDVSALVAVNLYPPLLVTLCAHHPVVAAAADGDRHARGLVLIATMREFYKIRRLTRPDTDFLQMQAAALKSL